MPEKLRVLYVDDERGLLDIGKLFLEEIGGFQIDTITSARSALEILGKNEYDAIISDYQMPGMDGIGFLKSVRAAGNTIPFILFTGKGREEIVIQALNEGADYYLQKGGDPEPQFAELSHKIRLAVQQRRTEASIRDHERREADIINFLPDATFAIDTNGIVIAWNRAMEDLTGVIAADILGKGDYAYALPLYNEQRPMLIDLILRDDPATEAKYPYVLRSGKKLFSEMFLPEQKNGAGMQIWFTASPIYDTKGRVVGAIESIRDITERKRAEEDIHVKNLILSTEQEASPDAILIVDNNGRILHFNHKFIELWGIPADLIASRIDEPVLHFVAGQQKDPDAFLTRVRELYAQSHERSVDELRLADGRILERHSAPMISETGKFYGRVWHFRDITERKRTEAALQESAERYKSLITVSHTGAWEYDADRDQVWCSPEYFTMLGRDAHQFDLSGPGNISRVWTDLLHPEDRTPAAERLKCYLEHRSPGIYESYFRMQHADGHWVWIWSRGWILRDKEGKPTRKMIGTHIDITESRQAEEQRRIHNEHLLLAQEIGQTGSWEFSLATGRIWASEEAFRIFSVPRPANGLIALEDIEARIPERERVHQALRDLVEQGAEYDLEYAIDTGEGARQKIIRSVARILYNAEKRPVAVAGVIQDITLRIQAENDLKSTNTKLNAAYNELAAHEQILRLQLNDIRESQNALKESEERYRLIDESSRDFIYSYDRQGRFTHASTSLCRALGLTPPQIIGRTCAELGFPEARCREWSSRQQQVLDQDGSVIFETTAPMPGGDIRQFEVVLDPIHDARGQITGISGTTRDITDRRKAESALRESEERYRRIVETANEGIWSMDAGFVTTYVNRKMADLLGYQPEEMTGRKIMEFMDPGEMPDNTLRMQNRVTGLDEVYERKFRHKDGSTRWMQVSVKALKDSTGAFAGSFAMLSDITGRKQAEMQLRFSEEKFAAAFEASPDPIAITEIQSGIILDVNQAFEQWSGFRRENVTGKSTKDADFWVDPSERDEIVQILVSRGAVLKKKVALRRRDGEVRNVLFSGKVIQIGGISYLLSLADDITDQERAEQELLRNHEELASAYEQITAAEEELRQNLDELIANRRSLEEREQQLQLKLDAILSPEYDLADTEFANIINAPEIQSLMDDFYALTGIGNAILDLKGNILIATGWQDICTKFHRVNPLSCKNCTESDLYLTQNVRDGEYLLYRCRNSLWDMVTPITLGNRHIGNLFLGQFFFEDEVPDYAVFDAQAEKFGFERNAYRAALDRVPRWSREKIRTCMDFYTKLTSMISRLSYSNLNLAKALLDNQETLHALTLSEEKFRQYVDHSPESIFVVDAEGRYIDVNRAACELVGYTREELLAAGIPRLCPPENLADEIAWFARLRKEGHFSRESELLGRDGTRIPVMMNAVRLPNATFMAFCSDITDRKNAGKALMEERWRLQSIIQGTRVGTWEWNVQTGETVFNERWAEIVGYTLGELSPVSIRTWESLTHPDDLRHSGELLQQHFSGKLPAYECEARMRHKDGRWIWVHDCGQVITWTPEGKPLMMFGTHMDITARKLAEAALRESRNLLAETQHLAKVGGWEWDVDRQRLTWTDETWRIHGIEPGSIVPGRDEMNRITRACYDPSDIDAIQAATRACLEEGTPFEFELPLRQMDGNHIWVRTMAQPVYDGDRIVKMVGNIMDITERKLAEEAHYESESRLRTLVETILDPIVILSFEGRVLFANPAAFRFIGFAGTTIPENLSIAPYLDPDSLQRAMADIRTIATGGGPVIAEYSLRSVTGERCWVEACGVRVLHEGAAADLVTLRDITGRKRAEEELKKTVMEYGNLLENMTDVYYRSDGKGNLIQASRSWADLLGYPDLSECLGRNIATEFYADPAERARFLEMVYREGSVADYEVMLKKKDGSPIPVATSSYLYFDDQGHIAGVEGTFRDMTERRRFIESLREAEQRLTDIINFLPDATLAIDREGRVIAWNRAIEEMTGIPAGEILGKGDYAYALPFYGERRPILIDLILRDDLEMKEYSSVRRDGSILTAETGLARLGDRDHILWGKASPLFNARGEKIGAIESIRDFTEQRMLEDSLKQLNRKLNLMSSITRHDISNQIALLKGYLRILEKKVPDVSACDSYRNLIAVAQSISSMIEFTREYEKIGVHVPVWQDCRSLVESAAADLAPEKVVIQNELAAGFEIYADPLIAKVLYNLMDNAVRYGETITTIRFFVEVNGDDALLICEDDGAGISPEAKEQIFERGYGKNTGLGLAISKEILAISGMTIRETGRPGCGARFEISMPRRAWRNA